MHWDSFRIHAVAKFGPSKLSYNPVKQLQLLFFLFSCFPLIIVNVHLILCSVFLITAQGAITILSAECVEYRFTPGPFWPPTSCHCTLFDHFWLAKIFQLYRSCRSWSKSLHQLICWRVYWIRTHFLVPLLTHAHKKGEGERKKRVDWPSVDPGVVRKALPTIKKD